MLKINTIRNRFILAVMLMMAMLFTSCSFKNEDNDPPTAPVLTIKEVRDDLVSLAWSESYDNEGVEYYKVFRDGEGLAEVDDLEYDDKDVTSGEEYEYYVVAYDDAGNRSSKSVRQRVKVEGMSGKSDEPTLPDEPTEPSRSKSGLNIQNLSRSTVKLYILDNDLYIIGVGSGTIIDEQGYILTNYHCVGTESGLYNADGYVAIAITDDIKKNIQPQYIAQYRSGVQELDLAVVKIEMDLNWNKVRAEELNLLPAKLADSDKVELGDEINILGYPDVGGETITFTAGRVSGFIDENNDSEVDWIKTDAIVNHGNSGGTAINGKGEMIGVPTAKQLGEDNDILFLLKPVNQAIPIVERAYAQGNQPDLPKPTPSQPQEPAVTSISIYGRVIDSYTMNPIRGAIFLVLKDMYTVTDFVNDPQDYMIQSYAEANRNGEFVCYDIPVGGTYSVLVLADGYIPILEDYALQIPSDWTEDLNLKDIYLEVDQ